MSRRLGVLVVVLCLLVASCGSAQPEPPSTAAAVEPAATEVAEGAVDLEPIAVTPSAEPEPAAVSPASTSAEAEAATPPAVAVAEAEEDDEEEEAEEDADERGTGRQASMRGGSGCLSREYLRGIVERKRRAMQRCYNRALEGDPDLTGELSFLLSASADGAVTVTVESNSDALQAAGVTDCIVETLQRTRLRGRSAPGESFRLRIPLRFVPPAEEPPSPAPPGPPASAPASGGSSTGSGGCVVNAQGVLECGAIEVE